MKRKMLFLVAVLVSVLLSSCGYNSGNVVGKFKVIEKRRSGPTDYYGFVTIANNYGDTLVMFAPEAQYLNIKKGETCFVGKKRKSLFLQTQKNQKPGIIGNAKVIKKKIEKRLPQCEVVTRGGDTITVSLVSEIVYFNASVGDSIFVRRNRDKDKPRYFVK